MLPMNGFRRLAHWLIVVNLAVGCLAATYMVFVVYAVDGQGVGPMMHAATEVPHEFFVERRLYALEAWMTFGFLACYLALTELRPGAGSAD